MGEPIKWLKGLDKRFWFDKMEEASVGSLSKLALLADLKSIGGIKWGLRQILRC